LRVERERTRDLEQALLAVGQVARFLGGEISEADELQQAHRTVGGVLVLAKVPRRVQRHIEQVAREGVVQADLHVLQRRHLAEQLHVLKGACNARQRDV